MSAAREAGAASSAKAVSAQARVIERMLALARVVANAMLRRRAELDRAAAIGCSPGAGGSRGQSMAGIVGCRRRPHKCGRRSTGIAATSGWGQLLAAPALRGGSGARWLCQLAPCGAAGRQFDEG